MILSIIFYDIFSISLLRSLIIFLQGYLPTEASVLDVEVWGLGGKKAKEIQDSYRNREALFTEQRRKVKFPLKSMLSCGYTFNDSDADLRFEVVLG